MSRDYQILLQRLSQATELPYQFVERTLDAAIDERIEHKIKNLKKEIKESKSTTTEKEVA